MRILRLPGVKAKVGLSGSTIYAKIKTGSFPRPINLGPRASGWDECQLDDWLRQCAAVPSVEAVSATAESPPAINNSRQVRRREVLPETGRTEENSPTTNT